MMDELDGMNSGDKGGINTLIKLIFLGCLLIWIIYETRENDFVESIVSYIIIADQSFESTLAPFIEWKTQKGYHVIVGNTSEIGSSTSSIKNFIENLYENPSNSMSPPSFVLFVGDIAQMPSYNGSTGSHPTDLYYVDMSGDMIPDIFHGRFSAQNISHLQSQINK